MAVAGLGIPFAPVQAGDETESYWIRLVPVEQADEGAGLEEAAALIDELYSLSPCDSGDLGTGGEADDAELPEQEEFLARAVDMLDLRICKRWSSGGEWEAEVDVLRSHQDIGYTLESETAEIGESTVMTAAVTETLDGVGASHDLKYPYHDGITASGGAEIKEVRGSTVFFAAPVEGRVRLSYTTVYDRVKLTIRPDGATGQGGPTGSVVVSGSAGKKSTRESASVVVFWGDIAVECTVSPPPEDDSIDAAEIERICNPRRSQDDDERGECWQTKEYYNICNCSGREAPNPPEPEDIDAPCPEGTAPGAFLGTTREMAGYVDCDRETEDLADPGYYLAKCCESPTRTLPRCREMREPYRGGAEIEHGPDYYKGIYGESVVLTAVTPEGGCGEIVRHWQVAARDCGDTPPPVVDCDSAPAPTLPYRTLLVHTLGVQAMVSVTGGLAPFVWTSGPGCSLVGVSADSQTAFFELVSDVRTYITVTDVCGRRDTMAIGTPNNPPSSDDPRPGRARLCCENTYWRRYTGAKINFFLGYEWSVYTTAGGEPDLHRLSRYEWNYRARYEAYKNPPGGPFKVEKPQELSGKTPCIPDDPYFSPGTSGPFTLHMFHHGNIDLYIRYYGIDAYSRLMQATAYMTRKQSKEGHIGLSILDLDEMREETISVGGKRPRTIKKYELAVGSFEPYNIKLSECNWDGIVSNMDEFLSYERYGYEYTFRNVAGSIFHLEIKGGTQPQERLALIVPNWEGYDVFATSLCRY